MPPAIFIILIDKVDNTVIMMELVVRRKGEGGRKGDERTPIIDVDVHEGLSSVEELLPYLGEPWRARVEEADGWRGIDTFPYSYPQVNGLVMAEAVTENGAPAGSDYVLMREQLLDAYDVEYAVLVSALQPTDMRVQPEFAAALASALGRSTILSSGLRCATVLPWPSTTPTLKRRRSAYRRTTSSGTLRLRSPGRASS
jgi:hypothetical protein